MCHTSHDHERAACSQFLEPECKRSLEQEEMAGVGFRSLKPQQARDGTHSISMSPGKKLGHQPCILNVYNTETAGDDAQNSIDSRLARAAKRVRFFRSEFPSSHQEVKAWICGYASELLFFFEGQKAMGSDLYSCLCSQLQLTLC